MPQRVIREVISNQEVGPGDFKLEIKAPEIAKQACPGQFVHLKWANDGGSHDPLLRRPLSFNEFDPAQGKITIIYRVIGRGTKLLSQLQPGDQVDLMGPLGNGFSISDEREKVAVVGGGMGIAPLLPLVKKLIETADVTVFLGAESKSGLLNLSYYQTLGVKTKAATEDGTCGQQGFVTDLLPKDSGFDHVYTCGPTPMMEAVQHWAQEEQISGEASLEERMGCGTGACLSCVCQVKVSSAGNWEYQKACTDGPIFPVRKVIFDE